MNKVTNSNENGQKRGTEHQVSNNVLQHLALRQILEKRHNVFRHEPFASAIFALHCLARNVLAAAGFG